MMSKFSSYYWEGESREIDSWPLMKSPIPIVVIFTVYLVLVQFALPKFMKRRQAYELTTVTRCYNAFQVIFCMLMVKRYYENGWSYTNAINCRHEPSHEVVLGVAGVWWLNAMIRIVELVETVFFILRKKFNQASFLHIYHHISSIAIIWVILKYEPKPMWIMHAVTNNIVHIIMYFYYFLSSFNQLRKITSLVKPLITIVQIVQLTFFVGHCVYLIIGNCPTNFAIPQMLNVMILIYYFVRFYLETYKRHDKKTPTSKSSTKKKI